MRPNHEMIITGIREVLDRELPVLETLPEYLLSERKNSQGRTVKQILGHLVDSASNNHQRMVRLQYNKHLDFPDYRQDNDRWIRLQNYQQADWQDLVQLWKYYNLHLIRVIRSVDPDTLENDWADFEGTKVTLDRMIEGYLGHLHLHIAEIRKLI